MRPVQRFEGGRRWVGLLGAVGLLGLLATAVGAVFDLKATLYSYLFGWVYWLTVGLGALLILTSFHASKARWPVVLRRPLEAMSSTLWPLLVLFLPIAVGVKTLFVWVSPPAQLGQKALDLLTHKTPYLNVPFFLVRTAVYFALWLWVVEQLRSWSRRQDETGDPELTRKQWWLSAGSMPFAVLAMSFAALDWCLSLEPLSYSTIYGFYFFSGCMLGGLGVLALLALWAKGKDQFGAFLNPAHYMSIGKLLLAATAFWGYIAFCQYMLIWIANVPDEVPYMFSRTKGAWQAVAVVVFCGQFLVPFFAFLSRGLKQHRGAFTVASVWVLVAHAFDIYLLVLPALHPDRPWWRWTDLTALVGVGGVVAAFGLWASRGQYPLPVKDPYLRHSLRYNEI